MSFSQVFKKYFYFVLKNKKSYIGFVFFAVIQAFLLKIDPYIYGEIIDLVSNKKFESIAILVLILLFIKFLIPVVQFLREFTGRNVMIHSLWQGSHMEYIRALQYMDYEYHTNKSSGTLVSLAKRGKGAMPILFFDINGHALIIVLEFILTFIILSTIHLPFALVLLGTFTVSLTAGYFLVRFNVKRRNKFNDEDDKITALTVDNMIGFETVKIFAKEKWEQGRFRKSFIPWSQALNNYIISFNLIDITIGFITLAGLSIIFFMGINSLKTEAITIGAFVAAMVYVLEISRNTSVLMYRIRDIAKVYVDIRKYFEVMELKPEIKDPKDPLDIEKIEGDINFRNLSFAYGEGKEALKNVRLEVNKGKKIALVGKSGSGKTTLTKLLMRFYDTASGEILLDGHNIKRFKLETLRKSIGLVPQEAVLFNDTIEYNIAYGRPGASQEEVEEAAKQAQLHDFIKTLPKGYETIVGERGIKLSGGQKQRLAIARVILEDPAIVIFDEATSQLDSENERKIQEAFDNLTKDKTTIIIAHRLSTIMNADQIIVFHEGQIVQRGRHEDLINQEGVYRKLWRLQTEVYNE